jgi:L-serine/L-threonine ammonia-lyase
VVEGLHRNGWGKVPVVAVETLGADSYARSLQAGTLLELPAITSLATSLGARKVSAQAFELAHRHPIESRVVSDREAVEACLRFMLDHRVVVEPACGAALAVAYRAGGLLSRYDRVLVIVCGGVTATVEQLQRWGRELPA